MSNGGWVGVAVLVTALLVTAYIWLRGPESRGPEGTARCRQCNGHFDNSDHMTTEQMRQWREWGLVLCRNCAAGRVEI